MSEWTDWTPCEKCTQVRRRNVTQESDGDKKLLGAKGIARLLAVLLGARTLLGATSSNGFQESGAGVPCGKTEEETLGNSKTGVHEGKKLSRGEIWNGPRAAGL